MKTIPRVYESDFFKAVREVHLIANKSKWQAVIMVPTVHNIDNQVASDFMDTLNPMDYVHLDFVAMPSDVVTDTRYWKLLTEITIVPDRYVKP